MAMSIISFLFSSLHPRFLSAAKWTVVLTLTAAAACLAPGLIFTNATSISSSFSKSCRREGHIRIPLDLPGEVICFPTNVVMMSTFDFFLPTVFAALGVGVSACLVKALGSDNSDTAQFVQN